MPSINLSKIKSMHPDVILPPDPVYAEDYSEWVRYGKLEASRSRVAFVAICRNAVPFVGLTMSRVTELGNHFKEWKCFVYENDSTDGTKEFLQSLGPPFYVSINTHDRPHLNSTKSNERTMALAEYRTKCQEWVRDNCQDYDYVIVFDTDPWGGWSNDGVLNSIGHMSSAGYKNAAAFASYSVCECSISGMDGPQIAGYDSWAARFNHWEERHMLWFHLWHPPVGSQPVKFRSAFGQLCVYRHQSYLSGVYDGRDCEHVGFHRSIAAAGGGDLYLNPAQRVVSFWALRQDENSGDDLHCDVHSDVDGGGADSDNRGNSGNLG
jgi:hypothetical protein